MNRNWPLLDRLKHESCSNHLLYKKGQVDPGLFYF